MTSLFRAILVVGLIGVGCARASAQTSPASPDFAQTPMRVQELRGVEEYLYADGEAPTPQLGDKIRELSTPMIAARADGKVQFAGQMILTMTGANGDRVTPVKIRVGFPIRPGGTAPEGTTIGKLESHRAATTVFSGSTRSLSEGFVQLYTEAAAAGLEPTGEMRQIWAYFEGPESENNVFILQVLVK